MTPTIDPAAVKEECQRLSDFAAEEYQRGKRDGMKDMLPALNEAMPWVATAMAGRRDKRPEFDAHPQAIKNHEKALAMLQAAIRKAESP